MYKPVTKRKRNTKYGNNNWFRYSSKINRNVYFYSDLEFDHWLLIEFDRSIKEFCEQPLHVNDYVNGEYINTIFDMWTIDVDRKEMFIEVKYSNELDLKSLKFSPRSFRQVQSQKLWCQEMGYDHEVHTDEWIYKNRLYVNNLRKIIPYIDKRKPNNEVALRKVLNVITNQNKCSVEMIEARLHELSKHQVRECVCNLIYDGIVIANTDTCEFGKNLEVWMNEP
ncbi:hypothetical protein EJP82_06610 [Paenibacillus anaericanus]|uniref:TnsA endonuclease N-terminal domain-containing protein n=1 Tax=Paenibacillus anaericanus TaxID=170367 RepID=A0A3S1DLK0_9BACL|nr:hypothetical protein [Paenibacillus anaericanus]RUT47378.1 hypothetical protein EJP82_06610 [Paenibacillus anaericanus]